MDFELTEQQKAFRKLGQDLAREFAPRAREWDEERRYPEENHRRLAELGLLGMTMPVEYGGGGAGLLDCYLIVEEIAKVCVNTAVILHDQNVAPRIIALYAPDELKRRVVPEFARGEAECTIAMTEPNAGSALTELTTTAVRDGDEYVVNGRKIFTSFADRAAYHLVFARFAPGRGARGIGTILVERDRPGVSWTPLERKLGVRGIEEGEVIFEDVRVPAANVVIEGRPDSSEGFTKPLSVYNATRVGMGVMAVGVAQGAIDAAVDYMRKRQQFGRYLAEFQGLQWMLADMAIAVEGARMLCYQALARIDAGDPSPYLSAVAKVYATESAIRVVNDALQLHGGYGYFASFPLERMLRDVRMFTITGGTTQVLKNLIASEMLGLRERRRG
ncbi:MAG: acyl-CoA dehydrogenase family protein [Clostridia bacterium]|nr:acyl-CoA dehydrogenase family protein [Clostridia bacterium]